MVRVSVTSGSAVARLMVPVTLKTTVSSAVVVALLALMAARSVVQLKSVPASVQVPAPPLSVVTV